MRLPIDYFVVIRKCVVSDTERIGKELENKKVYMKCCK